MKQILLLALLFRGFALIAQSYFPYVAPLPKPWFDQLREENPYILSLVNDGADWQPSSHYIREFASNIHHPAKNIISAWVDGKWEKRENTTDSFVLDDQNRLFIVIHKTEINYPSLEEAYKLKYIFTYNNSNQLARLDFFKANSPTSNIYQKTLVTYYTYDTEGKRIQDSNVYYTGLQNTLARYTYTGNKLNSIVQLMGTDSTRKTYYTHSGDLLLSQTSFMMNSNTNEWELSYADTFEYNVLNQLSGRRMTGLITRNGVTRIEPITNDSYLYTSNNKLLQEIKRMWLNGTWVNFTKRSITYDANQKAVEGYEYVATTAGWNPMPRTKYLFSFHTALKPSINPLSSLVISPNPANDFLTINLDKQEASLQLFDITGKCVYRQMNVTGQHTLNLSGFDNGIYYLQIQNAQFKRTSKIMVSH